MMEPENEYLEDQNILLPNIVDGPTAIGDLWNCQTSKLIGLNLFGKKLDSQNLQANIIKELKYTLTHVRNTTDKHKFLQVSGEVALELLSGLIKIGGEAEYESDEQSYVSEEELLCHYDLKTFSVKALPSAKEVMDELVKEKVLNGEIKATHVVVTTILGAEVTASIRIRETKSNTKEDIKGNFFGKLIVGPISASAKVALGKLDTNENNDFEKKIKVNSKPFFNSQPVTVSEMFQFIEGIGKKVEEEKHPAFINPKDSFGIDVYGVPLRFDLIPIKHFLDVPVEKIYMQIKDDVLDKIATVLTTLKDFQIKGFLKKRILEREPRLKKILLDQNNPLVVNISQREKEIRELAKQHYCSIAEILKGYKNGKFDQQDLLKNANKVDEDISVTSVLSEVLGFTSAGQTELLGIRDGDFDDSHQLRIFTNSMDMKEWYQTQKPIKVLLRTGGNCVNSSRVICLYDISRSLKDIGIEVGVATPMISDGCHELSIKIEDREQTYSIEEISFVIQVLLLLVNKADQTSTRLFTIYTSLNGIKLPFQNHLTDLHSMINILHEIKDVKVADSYLKLRDLTFQNDGRWKFVMDLNAFDSAAESINKFKCLNVELSDLEGDWIVGNFGFESSKSYSNAPLLFIFKDEAIQGVCLDSVDILLLTEAFKSEGDTFFKLLYPDKLTLEKTCLHKDRADFALKTVQLIQSKHSILENEPKVSKSGAFSSAVNQSVKALQVLVRSFLANDDINLWGAMANIVLIDFPNVKSVLQSHTWIDEVSGFPAGFKSVNPQRLANDLKEFFSTQDEFWAKIHVVLECVSCLQSSSGIEPQTVECINKLTNDPNCPEALRKQLESCKEIQNTSSQCEMVGKILKSHTDTVKGGKFENIALFIKLLEISAEDLKHVFDTELLPKLVARLQIDESAYPMFHTKLWSTANDHDYFMMLHVLAQLQYVEQHFLVCNQLESITSTADVDAICQLLGKVTEGKLTSDHYEWLFTNPKFLLLLNIHSNCSQLLQTIKFYHCQKSNIPNYIPDFLRESLQAKMEEDRLVECPNSINSIDEAVIIFQKIVYQNHVPDNFGKVLGDSVIKSLELKTGLEMANALVYWSEERKLFTETWNCEIIKDAYNQLIEWKQSLSYQHANDGKVTTFNIELFPESPRLTDNLADEVNLDQQHELDGVSKSQEWKRILGSYSDTINPGNFLDIRSILAEPRVSPVCKEGHLASLLPYIIQRLKMWGIHVIQQENLAKLSNSTAKMTNKRRLKKVVFDDNTSQSSIAIANAATSNINCPIARIDILTCLNAVCHNIVFQDLLRVIAQFPVALPLVLKELHKGNSDYVCLVPLLKSTSVKWEVQSGVVLRNQLFINPFKMVVALRVGSAKPGSSGKSTVLNQVMASKNMFSSIGGPGAEKGVPMALHGSVELSVLLQETCSYSLWESLVKNYYSLGSSEVLMLANVHGDALELLQTIKLLKELATSFIVFFMPCTKLQLQTRSTQIQQMLDDTEDIIHILIDPTSECEGQATDIINTNQLTLDNTLETVRSALGDAIEMGSPRTLMPFSNVPKTITLSAEIFAKESELLLSLIKKIGCKRVRSILQLQKMNPKYTNNYISLVSAIWKKEAKLNSLIRKFARILNLPIKSRLLAFAHLDRELSLLTASESVQIREKLRKFQDQKRRALNLEGGSTLSPEQKRIVEQIRLTMDELDNMSLGMEHFYRELGRIYQAAQCTAAQKNGSILSLPDRYAELLINGHAIEILDGDIGDMCGAWLNSICHSVCKSYPDLRIFTLSIIGLQSSGKSTLLNALFACKFAVSVGRCTRGLFMRLIFLDKSLADEVNIDAILLIDTEGLGAPEKLNDPEAEHKDRLLATFAMSVSNLTLINVLGESIRDLTDILQIVIVTMARLEKADISPDILMVQHLSERDSSKTMKGADEFCKALEEAVSLTDTADMAIGVRNCKSLRKLETRVKNGQLLKQFRPFKNGASANAPPSQEYHEDVVDLYKTILNACKLATNPQKFHAWHELIQNYWAAVSVQDFSLRFKNIQEVHEFINRGSNIAKVKESVDGAFRIHREDCEKKLRQKIQDLANNPEGARNWDLEKENELQCMRAVLKWIPHSCRPPCSQCSEAVHLKDQLFRELEGKNCQQETETTINIYIQKTRESVIKHLSQMAEAIWVKHGYTCEFDAIIGSILIEKLEDEPNPSETERKQMADEVWSRVERQISQRLKVSPAKERICNEVKVEYNHANAVSTHFSRASVIKEFPKLRCIQAVEFTKLKRAWNAVRDVLSSEPQSSNLNYQQASFLESQLEELPHLVLNDFKASHFEDGMVRRLKERIDKVLEEFERKDICDGKLVPKFKWEVHVHTLLKFIEVMTVKEEEWNRNNNPYYILRQNENTYREKIYIRLKHGFGFDAEGRIIGDLLLKAIRKRGQKQGDRAYVYQIRSTSWLTSSENVRLSYFSKLAEDVQKGDKQQALKHFNSPKSTIEEWFEKEVDSFSPEEGKKKFIETVDTELEHVVQEIRNQKTCRQIKEYVVRYCTQVEDTEYNPGTDLDSGSTSDFDLLRKVILKKLEEDNASLKLCITLMKPSTHSEIRSLLGCTEHCYWCGSLCWGQAGHWENMDSTKKHHACHQPMGLIGIKDKYELYLNSPSCDTIPDTWKFYWGNCNEGKQWPQVKLHEDFVKWTFTPHNKSEFNELMKWFFLNLHIEIANSKGIRPARQEDLRAYGFSNLASLDHILTTIKTRI